MDPFISIYHIDPIYPMTDTVLAHIVVDLVVLHYEEPMVVDITLVAFEMEPVNSLVVLDGFTYLLTLLQIETVVGKIKMY